MEIMDMMSSTSLTARLGRAAPASLVAAAAGAALLLVNAGCGATTSEPDGGSALETRAAALEGFEPSELSLGQGAFFPPTGIGEEQPDSANQCLVPDENIVPINRVFGRVSASSSKEQASAQISLDLGSQNTIEGIDPIPVSGEQSLGAQLDGAFESSETNEVLTLVIRVDTVMRSAVRLTNRKTGEALTISPNSSDPDQPEREESGTLEDDYAEVEPTYETNAWCTEGSSSSNLRDFVRDCGTHFLSSILYGGYIIIDLDISEAGETLKGDLDAALNTDLALGEDVVESSIDVVSSLNALNSTSSSSVDFQVAYAGIPAPDSSLVQPDGTMTPAAILTYIDDLRADTGDSTTWGSPVHYNFSQYTPTMVYDCVFSGQEDRDAFDSYQCFVNRAEFGELYAQRLTNMSAVASQRLALSGNVVRWGDSETEDRAEIQSFIDDVAACQLELEQQSDCKEAFDNSSRQSEWCSACNSGSEACDLDDLSARFGALPVPVNIAIAESDTSVRSVTANAAPFVIGNPIGSVCTWTDVRGRFRSSGDRVEIVVNSASREFEAEVDSSFTSSRRKAQASTRCLPQRLSGPTGPPTFDDGSGAKLLGTTGLPSPEDDAAQHLYEIDSTDPSPTNDVYSLTGKYAAYLRGFAGDFRTVGDNTDVSQASASGNMFVRASSESSGVEGFGGAFGVSAPAGGNAYFVDSSGNVSQGVGEFSESTNAGDGNSDSVGVGMAPVDRAFCVLTSVGGELDSTKERIKIYQAGSRWGLRTYGACTRRRWLIAGGCAERKEVSATAICYAFDQNP